MGLRDFFNKLATPTRPGGQQDKPALVPSAGAGTADIEVSGESYRFESFTRIFVSAGRTLGGVLMRTAVLVPEPENRYDRYAVGVYIDGLQVGWVPAEEAPRMQGVANAFARAGRQLTVLARVWACSEAGDWSARVTLSFSGQSEHEWSYVDHGAWPGNRSPDGTQRLTRTGQGLRIDEAQAAGLIGGQDFESLRPQIAQARADSDLDTAMRLLKECIGAAERRAAIQGCRPTVWPTEQATIVLRKQKDHFGEILLLERYLAADPSGDGTQKLRERLDKARSLAGQLPGTASAATQPATGSGLVASGRLDLDRGAPMTVLVLDAAAEVSYEKEHKEAIAAAFHASGAVLGAALETTAVLRETAQPGKRFSPVAVYVNGHLIGFVGALYADTVREALRRPHLADKIVQVRCRIYARENPWTARATLGPYESVVTHLEDAQSAAEGRVQEAMLAELRLQRQNAGGEEARIQAERMVRSRDFVEWVETIKQLRREGNNDEAFVLLSECIDAAERDAKAHGYQPPYWYTEQVAIILRKRGDLAGEVAALERFLAASPPGQPQPDMAERLIKARAKIAQP
ncbi:hypothetical protein DE4585_03887 [Mycobacteroides salmoniphilum]|uniref:HIRAN domain-containing protein n=1 Tax=Mycobacteroides salmoniphilum TaxID=404941 RepID=A0A4R8S003_9MYCO|nr:HIRAN domain-containing protein [Mycobacteroides salmoniphilum]TDZ80136.1 hypothetical protein DE4585_03887 [Mycobacteroides salmoniphilum]